MVAHTGPRAKRRAKSSRSVGMDLGAFGIRPYETKCKHASKPGQPGKRRHTTSKYGKQKDIHQAMSTRYGVTANKFRNYFKKAKQQPGPTDENLIAMLESRLANVVYTMGFSITLSQARQMVSHGHIEVNGKVISCSGYAVKPGDKISVKESVRKQDRVQSSVQISRENPQEEWVEVDFEGISGVYMQHPSVEQVKLFDSQMLGEVIVFYSK